MYTDSKVSVIVTCYNQGKYLNDSITSILNQSWVNWECLIIDDGSTDDSLSQAKIFEEMDSRIKVYAQKNSGVSKARNLGLSLISGDYVQFLDADDFIHPGKFAAQLEVFQQFPEVDLCFGSSRYFLDGNPGELYPLHPNGGIPVDLTKDDSFQVEMIFKNNICSNCSLLLKKIAVEKVRFREVIYEDWVFNLELALNNFKFHYHSSKESYSFIRMTKESQMNKHTSHLVKYNEFVDLKNSLIRQYGYSLNENLFSVENRDSTFKMKKWIKYVIPPIIYDAFFMIKKSIIN